MNILLWVLQVVLAAFFSMGAVNQLFNYEQLTQQFAIYQALPRVFWLVYGTVALLGVLGLLLTRLGRWVTPAAAFVLAAQELLFSGLYVHYAGFTPTVFLWAIWTLGPATLALLVGFGRLALKPAK